MVATAHAYPMTAQRTCAKCGKAVDPSLLDNFCLQCLVDSSLNEDLSATNPTTEAKAGSADGLMREPADKLELFADYELLEEIARGGMGVVYKARQLSVGRIVAVKMILSGQFADKQRLQRFRGEVAAAGLLHHPNIVAVHEVGMHAGQPFFSMDYVEGQNLAQLVGGRPLAGRQASRYVKVLAEAVEYAHSQGILHRDLKPSNVIIEAATDQPRLTDFGLAKRLGVDSSLTVTGQVLGSPNFMPPEQASPGHGKVGRHSDVYGLGAILYYLMTGRAPFQGESLPALAVEVVNTEPVSPRLLNPAVPRDLETICLKSLEKEPSRRYATAQDLADELGRFLADEPVWARPIGPTGRVWRWCRRRPAMGALCSTVLLLLVAVLIGTPVANIRISRARAEAEWNLYASDMRLASDALRDGQVDQVRDLLQRHVPVSGAKDLRGFEWRYFQHASDQASLLTRQFQGLRATVVSANPVLMEVAGTLYNFHDETSPPLVWNIATWAPARLDPPNQAAGIKWRWYPRQQAALAVNETEHTVATYRLPSFATGPMVSVPGRPFLATVSSDLSCLAAALQDHRILVWNLTTGADFKVFGEDDGTLSHLEFSPNGHVLLAAFETGAFRLWSVPEGKLLPSPPVLAGESREDWCAPPSFNPQSSCLLLNRHRKHDILEVWDWTTGHLSKVYQSPLGYLQAFAFSHDGAILATAGTCEAIVILDTKDWRQIGRLPVNSARVTALAFSPSDNVLASASLDHTAKLWDFNTQREFRTLGGNDDQVIAVLFSPDGSSLVAQLGNGTVKVWKLSAVLGQDIYKQGTESSGELVVSADKKLIATRDAFGAISVWDLPSKAVAWKVQTDVEGLGGIGMSFSPINPVLSWVGSQSLGTLDCRSGETNTIKITPVQGVFYDPVFSPDGREIAYADPTNILMLEIATRASRKFASVDNTVVALNFSPSGSLLASAHVGGAVTLWEYPAGRQVTNIPTAHPPFAFSVEFSRDGRLLVSGGADGSGKLWEVIPGGLRLRHTLRGELGWMGVTFSPDGRRIVSNGRDDKLTFWDTETGSKVGTFYGHGGPITGFAFSPDGSALYSAAQNGDILVWRAPPPASSEVSEQRRQLK